MENIQEFEKYLKEVALKIRIIKYEKIKKELYFLMLEFKRNQSNFELDFKESLSKN